MVLPSLSFPCIPFAASAALIAAGGDGAPGPAGDAVEPQVSDGHPGHGRPFQGAQHILNPFPPLPLLSPL